MNPSVVNLFRLQRKFEKYLSESWPWLNAKTSVFTSESEYRFGADYDEILRTDAGIIVDKFFWPKKVLTQSEYQECLDLTKNMVLTAWGRLYTHLSTSEKSRDMSYCDQKYDEFLKALNKWMPAGCPGPKEYIGRWARDLGKDKEIFDFLYARREGMTIRDFLTELFKYKRVQLHAMKAGHDINSFESMLKFMPEEHQKAYAELVAEEESYKRRVADYNAKVEAYNQRKAERERIEKENAQVYTRTVERTVEADEAPEAPAEAPSEQEEQLDEQPEESKSASSKVLEQAGNALGKAADFAGKMLGGITVYAEESPEGESEQPESVPPADDKNNAALEGLVKVMKPVAVCGIITGALAVSVAHPTTTPLMAVGAKVAVDAVLSFEVKKPNDGAKTDDAEVEQLPATEEASEQATVPEVLEEEVHAHLLKEMPDGLPLPNVPRKPNWWEIGWRRLMGRSINDTIWDRWFPPEPSNYAGGVRPCSEPAGLGEVNDEELNRLDWELERGFNEGLQSEKDFMDGVRVGFLKNMTKLPFNLAGFVLNSREVQDMPDKLESSDVEDEGAYLGGKITADVMTTVLGIIGVVSGVGQMVTGLAGDVGGGALCASGVGIPAGVAVVAGSTTLVVAGAAEVAASASLVYSSVSNLGRDVDELKKAKEKAEKEKQNSETAKEFEERISKLDPNDRSVAIKEKSKQVAKDRGLEKDRKLSKRYNRDIYQDPNTKEYYSLDERHGRFEHLNKRGKHLEEVNFDFIRTKPADPSGGHDINVK